MEEQTTVGITPQDVQRFTDLIKREARGRNNALYAYDLKKRLGFSPRTCRALANEANRLGTLIVGTNAGYFIPANRAEADESIGRLRSQGQKMSERAEQQENLAREKFGTLLLEDEEPDSSRQLGLFE